MREVTGREPAQHDATQRVAHEEFVRRWAQRLERLLPGRRAQARFEPDLCFGRHFGPPGCRVRRAAVVVLFYPHQGQWHLPLTIRTATLAAHGGQISLPGGALDPGESGPEAAVRELAEELGVASAEIEVVGALSPLYLFVSDFLVTPWIAAADHRPEWVVSQHEVAELLEIPLAHLMNPANQGRHTRRQRGVELAAPHFHWNGHHIWGATGMILGELVAVAEECS